MNRLNQIMNQTEKAENKKKKQKSKKESTLPVYDMKGQNITPEKKKRDKRIAILILTLTGIIVFLYFPGMFIKSTEQSKNSDAPVQTDTSAIRKTNSALRNNPSEDYDGDGLTNSEETTLGTDPWHIDTDGDGASDYYEAKISNTDPLTPDSTLLDVQTKNDKAKGKKVGSPYKIGNVILWADDYDSKAYGTVVETTTGYHFCNFNGYAQFPSGKYVYRVKNGVRSLLSYRKDENAWKVSAGDLVEVYDEPLEEIVEFTFFTKPVYAEANTATELLAKMLPDKGFITAEKKMKIDVEPDTNKATVTDIVKPVFDSNDDYRYTVNNNTLNDLQFVRKSIEDDKSCIAVSLYNQEKGEYLAVIYGYTHSGDLLLADMNTLKPIGTLKITESARKMLDENGDIVSVSYFEFNGFGFSSNNGDRISFFASSSKTQSTESQFKKDSKKNTNDKVKENNKDTSKSEGSEKESNEQQDRTDNASNVSDFTDTLPSADTNSTDLDSTQSVAQ